MLHSHKIEEGGYTYRVGVGVAHIAHSCYSAQSSRGVWSHPPLENFFIFRPPCFALAQSQVGGGACPPYAPIPESTPEYLSIIITM